jgi:hypothetical protein
MEKLVSVYFYFHSQMQHTHNITALLVVLALLGTSFAATCSAPAVSLPGSNVPGPCPGTPAATITSAPYRYTLPNGYRFDYAYVKANDGNCKLVVLQGTQKCYQVTNHQSDYLVTFTGSKGCSLIKKVQFYTSQCSTPTPTPASTTTIAPTPTPTITTAPTTSTVTPTTTEIPTTTEALTTTATPTPSPADNTTVIPCSTIRNKIGNNTDTVYVEMGQSSGTFLFEYNPFNKIDIFNVYYENTLLFRSPEATGYNSTMISYSGASTQLTVTVEPNSDIYTEWAYEAHCVGDLTTNVSQIPTPSECYDANMIVNIMIDGKISQKRAGDIRRNDLVEVFNSDGTTSFERAIYSYDHDGVMGTVIRMDYENVVTGEKGYIAVTKNHVVLTSDDQEFANGQGVAARYIKKGTYLFGLNNAALKIVDISSYNTEIVSIQTHSLSLVVNGVYSYTYNYGSLFGFIETIGQRIGDYLIPESYDLTFLKTISPGFVDYGLPVVDRLYSIFN